MAWVIDMNNRLSYVLITPARNEEAHVEKTIRSVVSQTVLPKRWVVVSDGSTDRTDQVLRNYLATNPWIEFVRIPERKDRQFAAKVQAFNVGCSKIRDLQYDIIGNLDADISFEPGYFEFLLSKFEKDQGLGVVGTPFVEDGKHYDYRFTNIEHVSGACQLFRRQCFEDIGGYVPIKRGGIDWTAVTTARMKGWKTRTFEEKVCYHHRKIGTGGANSLGAWFRHGRKDYFLGGHPLWQLFRALYQLKNKPYLLGGFLLFAGYCWAGITREERPVSKELMAFHRKEQMIRLKDFFRRGPFKKGDE
jgi:biofilm PGA synthesis N-glycosyltransferase PgaC